MGAILNIMPQNFLVPGTAMKFDLTNAIRGLRGMPRAIVLCGFVNTPSPELLAGAVVKVTSEGRAIALAGFNSVLHQMYMSVPAIARMALPVYFNRLDESIGTQAQRTLTFNFEGELGADLPVEILCSGHTIFTTLTAGSDKDAVAAAIAAAVTENTVAANMTATAVDNVVTATCAFGGFESNSMLFCLGGTEKADIAIEVLPAKIDATGDQDLSSLFAFMEQTRLTQIAWPGQMSAATYATVAAQLTNLWGPETQRDTQALEIISVMDSSESAAILATRNCHQIGTLTVYAYLRSPVWCISAGAAGGVDYQAAIDPALPYRDIGLIGVNPPQGNFSRTERNVILQDGGSTLIDEQGVLFIERIVTNYTMSVGGIEDASYRNYEWVKTMSWWRWFCTTEFGLKYRNYKMAEVYDEAFDGQHIMTLELAEEVLIGLYRAAIDAGIMQDMDGYVADLVVSIHGASGRLQYLEKPRLVTQHYQTEITSEPVLGSL